MTSNLTTIVSSKFYDDIARAVEAHLSEVAGNPVNIISNHMDYDSGPFGFGVMIREPQGNGAAIPFKLIARQAWKFELHLFDDVNAAILALMSVLTVRAVEFINAVKSGELVGVQGNAPLVGYEVEGVITITPTGIRQGESYEERQARYRTSFTKPGAE